MKYKIFGNLVKTDLIVVFGTTAASCFAVEPKLNLGNSSMIRSHGLAVLTNICRILKFLWKEILALQCPWDGAMSHWTSRLKCSTDQQVEF